MRWRRHVNVDVWRLPRQEETGSDASRPDGSSYRGRSGSSNGAFVRARHPAECIQREPKAMVFSPRRIAPAALVVAGLVSLADTDTNEAVAFPAEYRKWA